MSLKTLGVYCAALHTDFLHLVDKDSYPSPQEDHMIRSRLEFQNAAANTLRWNEEIADCEAVDDMICVNNVKHRQPITFVENELYEQHRISSYYYRVPRVVFSAESREEGGLGSSSGAYQPAGRGRRPRPQPQTGFIGETPVKGTYHPNFKSLVLTNK